LQGLEDNIHIESYPASQINVCAAMSKNINGKYTKWLSLIVVDRVFLELFNSCGIATQIIQCTLMKDFWLPKHVL